jgi:hypothetical protein
MEVIDICQKTFNASTQNCLPGCFWGALIKGRKGPYIFFEKEWGNVNSEIYNTHALSLIEEYLAHNSGIFMQDNAPSHQSLKTKLIVKLFPFLHYLISDLGRL